MHPLSLLLKAGTGPEPRWSAVAPHARATQCGPSMLRAGNVVRDVESGCVHESAQLGRNPRERAANSLATASRVELQHQHALCLVDVEVRAVSSPAFLLPGPSVLVASSPVLPARAPCPYPLNKLTAPNPHPTILKVSSFNIENKENSQS